MKKLIFLSIGITISAAHAGVLDTPLGKACVQMHKPDYMECLAQCEDYDSGSDMHRSCIKACKLEVKQKLEQCIDENS